MGRLAQYFSEQSILNSFNDLPYPFVFGIKSAWIAWIAVLFLELIPAYLADFWQYLWKKPTKFAKMQAQLSEIRSVLTYFMDHSWVMQTSNMTAMAAELSPEDASLFPCDPSDICWKEYSATYYNGVKRYLVDKPKK